MVDNNDIVFDFNDIEISKTMAFNGIYITNIYHDNRIQSNDIKITSHGIPKPHPVYFPDDTKRNFIKIPLDLLQQSCVSLKHHLKKADDFFASDKTKKKILSFTKKSQYVPIIKSPVQIDTDEIVPKKCDYVKIKFPINGIKINVKDETHRLNNIAEIENYIKFGSVINFTFRYACIWIANNKYGVILIMEQIHVVSSNNFMKFYSPIYDLNKLKQAYQKIISKQKITAPHPIAIEI